MSDRITGPFERPESATEKASSWWAWLVEPWSRRDEFEIVLFRKIHQLEVLIMASTAEIVARLDAATNEVASDLAAVRDQLTAALADVDAAKRSAVDEALAQLDAPIARLEALGSDPADPVPVVADPPTPEPSPDEPVA